MADSCNSLLISEGIRGENEIRYALTGFPRWQIVELTLHPLTRLRRLSERGQSFDRAEGRADLSFLPRAMQGDARSMLAAGDISAKAVTIMRAEAENYGLDPFADGSLYANYHHVQVDDRNPREVAEAVAALVSDRINANN